jgi:hypothetical protein
MLIDLRITVQHLRLWLKFIILLNLLLLAGTFVAASGFHLNKWFTLLFRQSDLRLENIFASWYSSVLLFLAAILSFICFLLDKRRFKTGWNTMLSYGWLVYAACFAVLSFDEMGSIHEYIGDYMAFKKAGSAVTGDENSGWTVFYYLVAAVSIFMFVFSVLRLKSVKWSLVFFVLGLLLYLSNPLQENFEIASYLASPDRDAWKRPVHFALMEEGSELFGSLFFLIALSKYALFAGGSAIQLKMHVSKTTFLFWVLAFLAAFATGYAVVHYMFGNVEGQSQVGVPKNWITAMPALVVSLCMMYLYNYHKRPVFLALAILFVAVSIYFGCDRFSYFFR